jgi:predicted acyltransferase
MSTTDSGTMLTRRLVSLDAFRGLVILGMISDGFRQVEHSGNALIDFFQRQLTHVDWMGLHFHDIIFPSFLFIVGVALPFSFAKRKVLSISDEMLGILDIGPVTIILPPGTGARRVRLQAR